MGVVSSDLICMHQILVSMDNSAGVFQIEKVLERKIRTSSIQNLVEVTALEKRIQIKISENS